MEQKILTESEPKPRGLWRRTGWSMLYVGLVCLLAMGAGFYLFVNQINSGQYSQTVTKADGIVVLTGGHARLGPATQLLRDGMGNRLLVTGVNPEASQSDLASALGIETVLFECCVDLDYLALDTVGNAREMKRWAEVNNYSSLIVVTNDYHMPRSLSELSRIAPELELQAFAVSNPPSPNESFERKLDRYRVLAFEYAKFLLSEMRRVVSFGSA